jgi:hypothetical protein
MILQEMHYEFKLRYNKLDSNHKKDLAPAEIDALLNDAIFYYVECFYSGNNFKKYKLGFEVTRQRTDMLSTLVVRRPLQPLLLPTSVDDNVYEFRMANLAFPYAHYLRANILTECGLAEVRIEQHDDLNHVLQDPYRKPSKTWLRVVGSVNVDTASNQEALYIYTDGEFSSVTGLHLEYIKIPDKVFFGGYNSIEYVQCVADGGSNCSSLYLTAASPTVQCNLPSQYHGLVVDIAVQEAARILEDQNRFMNTAEKVIAVS